MRSTSGLAALAACLLASGFAHGADVIRRSVTSRSYEISLPSDSSRFNLPGQWIRPGSVLAVFIADRADSPNVGDGADTLRAGIDFELENTDGILRIKRPLPAGRLRIGYEIVPLAIGRVFQVSIPVDTTRAGEAPVPPRPAGPLDAPTSRGARLDIRGSKTVSLEFGSAQDLTVQQSLDVSLTGEVVPGVSVRGVLSDRQTPLQPEGRTTELTDLDRIFLQVDGPGASMTLGNFELHGPAGLFTAYDRQLEGVRIQGKRGPGQASLVAATIPGVYTTIDFLGQEGKQGPYLIRPAGASYDAVAIAGSERVWVDGELLVRGEDRDYLIDYAASTVTFTGRRIITGASRITVDLQLSSQPYRRNAYAAVAGWGTAVAQNGRGLGVRATLLAEHDDRSSPIGGPLTPAEREILRQAGDSLTTGLGSGVDCGAIGHGDYTWVEADSLHTPFLRFVGDSLGTCRVRFENVGERKGDYADSLLSGRTIYHYVGIRRGRFLPGRAVPLPSRQDLVDVVGFYGGPQGLRFEMEAAGSIKDPNTYSSINDANHEGGALRLHLARDAAPVRAAGLALGRWGIELESRDLDPKFQPLGRVDPGWYGYDWGIATSRLAGGNRRRSATLRNEPGLGFALEGAYETISNRRDLEGARSRFNLRRTGRVAGSFDHSRAATRDRATGVEISGNRGVDAATLGLNLTRAETSVAFRREDSAQGKGRARTGLGFDEWRESAAWLLGDRRGRLEVSRADRQNRDLGGEGRTPGDRSRTYEAHAAISPVGRLLDARYSRRDVFEHGGGTARSDIAGILWSQEEGQGRFSQQFRADLTTSQTDSRRKVIQYAGPGRGSYDSLGVYVGTGDYDVVLVPIGTSSLERRLDGSWRLELAPGRAESGGTETGGGIGRLWTTSQWILYASFSARTGGSAALFWRDLPSLLLARKEGVPLARHRVRAEASALPSARWLSPQVRIEHEKAESQAFQNVQSRTSSDLIAATLRSNPDPAWTFEQELQIDRDEEITRLLNGAGGAGSIGSNGWNSSQLRLGGWFRPSGQWTLRFGALGRLRDRLPGSQRYRIYQAAPGVQWLAAKGTRIDVEATHTWVEGPTGAYHGLETAGWEARGNLAIRLRSFLDATAVWNLLTTTNGAQRSSMRAELRATF